MDEPRALVTPFLASGLLMLMRMRMCLLKARSELQGRRESKVGSTLRAKIVLSGLTTVDMATVPFMLCKHYAHTALEAKLLSPVNEVLMHIVVEHIKTEVHDKSVSPFTCTKNA